jgi:hypothetical protein
MQMELLNVPGFLRRKVSQHRHETYKNALSQDASKEQTAWRIEQSQTSATAIYHNTIAIATTFLIPFTLAITNTITITTFLIPFTFALAIATAHVTTTTTAKSARTSATPIHAM